MSRKRDALCQLADELGPFPSVLLAATPPEVAMKPTVQMDLWSLVRPPKCTASIDDRFRLFGIQGEVDGRGLTTGAIVSMRGNRVETRVATYELSEPIDAVELAAAINANKEWSR